MDRFLFIMSIGVLLILVTPIAATQTTLGTPWQNYQKPESNELKKQITAFQYKITQKDGTEPPFNNPYWDNKQHGIYVDILSGEPLFSSRDKYKSGTGWPSFTRPLMAENLVKKTDFTLVWSRTEIRSKWGDNHIGHVFKDGPPPTGLRYCMNSAAMKFIPVEKMAEMGYAHFLGPFIQTGLIQPQP